MSTLYFRTLGVVGLRKRHLLTQLPRFCTVIDKATELSTTIFKLSVSSHGPTWNSTNYHSTPLLGHWFNIMSDNFNSLVFLCLYFFVDVFTEFLYHRRNGRWRSEWTITFNSNGGNSEMKGLLKLQVIFFFLHFIFSFSN